MLPVQAWSFDALNPVEWISRILERQGKISGTTQRAVSRSTITFQME
jgi:hypothetical protein